MATWKKITTEADLSSISASLTTTDQSISSSVASLSGSASDARNALAGVSGSASDARNELVTKISGSSTAPIAALSSSLTITDQAISASVAALSGSASDARDALSTDIELAALSASLTTTDQAISSSVASLSGSASDARNTLVDAISGSSTLPINILRTEVIGYSASLHNADQVISASLAALSGSASDARNDLANDTALSGSASDARNELVTKISGSSTAPIAALSASLTTTDQAISSSVASLSGSASDARNAIVSDISGAFDISFASTTQGELIVTEAGVPSTVTFADLQVTSDPTFNDLQVNGSATVEGDLTVKGTTTSVNTTNLLVEDKFALFASGSSAVTDGGVIIQAAADGSGKALGYSQANSRWSLQASLAHDATTFSLIDAFLGTVETSTAVPSTSPVYGVGTIHVKTDTEDIYIYS